MLTLTLMNNASSSIYQSHEKDKATSEQRSKRLKSIESPQDRISALPNSVIHRILSFLPTTQEAIKTCILSKRWNNQWTHVQVLHFDFADLSPKTFYAFIDEALARYDGSTILRFCIISRRVLTAPGPPIFWIHFTIRREVKELIIGFLGEKSSKQCLPQFLFNNDFLILLRASNWVFKYNGRVNWSSLKSLHMCNCVLPNGAIENVLSGSPLLESLEVLNCEVSDEKLNELVIATKSLKTLVLKNIADRCCSKLEIPCPNLEKLELLGKLFVKSFKLLNLPSSISATIAFVACELGSKRGFAKSFAIEILNQMHCVDELNIGAWFTKEPIRAAPFVTHDIYQKWYSRKDAFNCLPQHLKTVEIVGLYKKCYQYQNVLEFANFVLKRARVLEKMIIFLDGGCRLDFAFDLSKFFLNIPRRSPSVFVDIQRLRK